MRQRQEALKRYIAEAQHDVDALASNGHTPPSAPEDGAGSGRDSRSPPTSFEGKTLAFLKEKQEANLILWRLYNGQAGKENEERFFEASKKAWSESLPDVLNKLDQGIKGPFALGDQVVRAALCGR